MHNISLHRHLPSASSLVLGCMGLGGGWNQNSINKEDIKQAHQVIDTALDTGINIFDHADIYTFGKAEAVFGQVLSERPELREQLFLQSKCGIRFADSLDPKRYDLSAQWITTSTEAILQRLCTEYIDVLMLHRPDPLMRAEEVAEALTALKQAGKVKHFGVSNMSGQQMQYLQSHLDFPLVINQVEISLQRLDWLEEGILSGHADGVHASFTAGTLEYCRLNNVQLQSWGSLCQGLFSGQDVSQQPHHIYQTAELVSKIAAEHLVPAEAIVLAWLMMHPAGVQPVIGTTNPHRIRACQQACNVKLSREQWYALYESARGSEIP